MLELAFEQAHALFCQRILTAAQAGLITLAVPQFVLTEVFQTLGRRRNERARLRDELAKEIEQHRREATADLTEMDALARLMNNLLITRSLTQKAQLFALTAQLAREAPGPELTPVVIAEAAQQEQIHSLTPQDALVYASVLAGCRVLSPNEPKLFITRNKDDFYKAQLVLELRAVGCELMFDFRAASGRLGV